MIPDESAALELPPTLRAKFEDCEIRLWYHYDHRDGTYRLDSPDGATRFLKIRETGYYPSLLEEAERTRWAGAHLPVPHVADSGHDGVDWLLTDGLPGLDATKLKGVISREELTRSLARGLRRFHEAPVADCPFDFRLDVALEWVEDRVRRGVVGPEAFHPEFAHLTGEAALARLLETRPESEDFVVCHGDYCLPNALLEDGEVTGFIDLGEVGVADRWWDLAVATWSLDWNLGEGLRDLFLDEYGIEADEGRINYYRLLYDLVS